MLLLTGMVKLGDVALALTKLSNKLLAEFVTEDVMFEILRVGNDILVMFDRLASD